ncbi:RNA polymerase sigma factor (sigma-70 family) [Tamaricihabitans halophyticus]|uniref:RNA polymerase sigma factor (Sigma-70 family) n=1 Tax=Tamaricihabitans halophyticus TaxID=1262583 RepID=A0A4R2R8W5_9PSEU|nr:sigma-70 family RNA polymerase sigma factor [Tamaricihabitans halophyticus]TCP56101.1 RNA polymerase sigma factor (sigma-70 family) [Tamaricihabitans halophyticus]
MSTVPADVHGSSDAELIASVRDGQIEAYGTLYERHVAAAYNLARQLARSPAEADDLVSEAFSKVLDTLRNGRGPDSAFRAYLLTSLRHTAYDKTRRDRKVEYSDDVSTVGGVSAEAVSIPFQDTAVAGLERSLAARAFATLPERWQTVLWHTEIEQQSPAEVAPILGLTANGVSALAYRAREGLRQAYLQVHLAETTAERCRATADRLGAHVRDGLSKRERAQVEAHLDECDECRALAAELADVNGALRAIIAPLVLGGAVTAYLTTAGAAKASAATAGLAAAASGSAGSGVAGAAASGPRQFVGVGASGVAMVAAVTVAMAAGGGPAEIPTAAPPQEPPAAEQPAQPPAQQNPPAPQNPPAAPNPPAPPPAQPEQPPPAEPPAEPPPPEDPPQEQPGPPSLNAEPPPSVHLVPGGGPAELPITVRNTGDSTSEPVESTLNLPDGVRATSGNNLSGSKPLRFDAPRLTTQGQPSANQVSCPAGSGTVSCRSAAGLRPGQSVTLLYRLIADESASGGHITGTVVAGAQVNIQVNVKVNVTPPEVRDDVRLTAHAEDPGIWPWFWGRPVVHAVARNTGESTNTVTITLDAEGTATLSRPNTDCSSDGASTTCTTTEPIEPGERLNLRVKLSDRQYEDREVGLTATLGSATDATTVTLPGWPWPWPWPGPPDEHPTTIPNTPDVDRPEPSGTPEQPSSGNPSPSNEQGKPTGTPTPSGTPTPTGTPGSPSTPPSNSGEEAKPTSTREESSSSTSTQSRSPAPTSTSGPALNRVPGGTWYF